MLIQLKWSRDVDGIWVEQGKVNGYELAIYKMTDTPQTPQKCYIIYEIGIERRKRKSLAGSTKCCFKQQNAVLLHLAQLVAWCYCAASEKGSGRTALCTFHCEITGNDAVFYFSPQSISRGGRKGLLKYLLIKRWICLGRAIKLELSLIF